MFNPKTPTGKYVVIGMHSPGLHLNGVDLKMIAGEWGGGTAPGRMVLNNVASALDWEDRERVNDLGLRSKSILFESSRVSTFVERK
jgi:hypothetical protein